jgi:hypothetical protein
MPIKFNQSRRHKIPKANTELCRNLRDELTTRRSVTTFRGTSIPSWNLTPSMTFGICISPFNRRRFFDAAMMSLNTISLAVADESDPFVRTVL